MARDSRSGENGRTPWVAIGFVAFFEVAAVVSLLFIWTSSACNPPS
ncbi:MAG TPA: hypothetical protein VK646_02855 [Actinomycetota bacterium]|nr:hypothetical protein [Actinomycetota bacterium]